MATHSNQHGTDKGAAYTGLILGAVFVLAVSLTIVKLTNAHYAAEKAHEPAAAGATQH
jgi:hypothetical protein